MTPPEITATLALVAAFLACLLRARLLAFAILAPLLLAFAQWFDLVDTSSASHPLRLLVPLVSLSAAMFCAWREHEKEVLRRDAWEQKHRTTVYALGEHWAKPGVWPAFTPHRSRVLYASVITFASSCIDIPALFFWRLPGEWALVPLQILACFAVMACLLVPERWLRWTSRG